MNQQGSKQEKVVVGMSGGVDSSVTAYLLQQEGYEVIGVTMLLIPEDIATESPQKAINDAKKVADHLGIEHHVLDLRNEFRATVIDYFTDEYLHGRTPNPCIVCNKNMKFKMILENARKLGADKMATGHYAKIAYDEGRKQYVLQKGDDRKKDQSYFLYNIRKEDLAHILFPLNGYTKDQTRAIAAKIGLEVANKPDSQEICFIPDNDYKGFLEKLVGKDQFTQGEFIDLSGKLLGKHQGLQNYTIGQRKGLGLALGKPSYVVDIDAQNNRVVIGGNEDLFQSKLMAVDNNFLVDVTPNTDIEVEAKIRYRANPSKAILKILEDGSAVAIFEEPQRAITPGQGVCYYQGDTVVGGGTILRGF